MKKASVYLVPITFGFGPASHAAAIARELRALSDELRLVGVADGIAADFLTASGLFDEVIVEDKAGEVPAELPHRGEPAVAVAIVDFERALAIRQQGTPVVMVDALYWMWDRDPIDPASVDRYLCLAFPGVADRVQANGGASSQIKVIPQILDTLPPPATERSGVVLNFGGAVAPFGSNSEYLGALVNVVADVLGPDQDLLVTCSAHAGELLSRGGLPGNARVSQLTSDEMLRELGERELLLTLPGLSIMWEALRSEIPTAVLPGANYSQHRQVIAYQRHFASTPILTWNDLPGYEQLPPAMPEEQGGARALGLGREFAADPAARKLVGNWLRRIIGSRDLAPPALVGQHPWSSFDGAKYVVTEVIDMLDVMGKPK